MEIENVSSLHSFTLGLFFLSLTPREERSHFQDTIESNVWWHTAAERKPEKESIIMDSNFIYLFQRPKKSSSAKINQQKSSAHKHSTLHNNETH